MTTENDPLMAAALLPIDRTIQPSTDPDLMVEVPLSTPKSLWRAPPDQNPLKVEKTCTAGPNIASEIRIDQKQERSQPFASASENGSGTPASSTENSIANTASSVTTEQIATSSSKLFDADSLPEVAKGNPPPSVVSIGAFIEGPKESSNLKSKELPAFPSELPDRSSFMGSVSSTESSASEIKGMPVPEVSVQLTHETTKEGVTTTKGQPAVTSTPQRKRKGGSMEKLLADAAWYANTFGKPAPERRTQRSVSKITEEDAEAYARIHEETVKARKLEAFRNPKPKALSVPKPAKVKVPSVPKPQKLDADGNPIKVIKGPSVVSKKLLADAEWYMGYETVTSLTRDRSKIKVPDRYVPELVEHKKPTQPHRAKAGPAGLLPPTPVDSDGASTPKLKAKKSAMRKVEESDKLSPGTPESDALPPKKRRKQSETETPSPPPVESYMRVTSENDIFFPLEPGRELFTEVVRKAESLPVCSDDLQYTTAVEVSKTLEGRYRKFEFIPEDKQDEVIGLENAFFSAPVEKYLLRIAKGDAVDLIEDMKDVMLMTSVVNLPQSLAVKVSSEIVPKFTSSISSGDYTGLVDAIEQYNALIRDNRASILAYVKSSQHTLSTYFCHQFLQQLYTRIVTPQCVKLKRYKPFSNFVYGELLPGFVSDIMGYIQERGDATRIGSLQVNADAPHISGASTRQGTPLDASTEGPRMLELPIKIEGPEAPPVAPFTLSNKNFMDLGSGVGNTVFQAALEFGFRNSYGVEIMEHPSDMADAQLLEYSEKCKLYGLKENHVELFSRQSFFDNPVVKDRIDASDVLLCNNYAFDYDFNNRIVDMFKDLKPGTTIITLKPLVPYAFKITADELDKGSILGRLHVQKMVSKPGAVSWTNTPVYYYVNTVQEDYVLAYYDMTNNQTLKYRSKRAVRDNVKPAMWVG